MPSTLALVSLLCERSEPSAKSHEKMGLPHARIARTTRHRPPSRYPQDPHSLARLELSLINTKSSTKDGRLLPSQACTRGGIGVFLSTGSARGSLSRLPEALKTTRSWQRAEASLAASSRPHSVERSSHASRRASTGASFAPSSYDVSSLAAAAAASVVVGGGALVPEEAKREWERSVAHPYNFVTTARQTRIDDVRPASKWAAVSFFENNPKEVKRHMDIMSHVDRAHYEVRPGCHINVTG